MDLKPCANLHLNTQICLQICKMNQTFCFHLYWFLTLQWQSMWAGKLLIRWVGDLFNNILVISRRWTGDSEKLCAMEPRLRLNRSPPRAGLEPVTARPTDQLFTYWATRPPRHRLDRLEAVHSFLARLEEVQEELLYHPGRRRWCWWRRQG